MAAFWQDVAYAVRGLRKAPGFTFVTVLVLALGIGANSAIFSLVDAALVRLLPFAHPERLVMLWERSTRFAHNRVSPLNFLDWSEQQHAFASVAAIAGGGRTLTGSGGFSPSEWPGAQPARSTANPVSAKAFVPKDTGYFMIASLPIVAS